MEETAFEANLRLAFTVATVLLRPFARLETFCLWLLGIDVATTFRMLPERDAHPEFPAILPNGISFIFILMIPYLVWRESHPGLEFYAGWALRPLKRRCGRWGQWALMLPRVWLYTAMLNHSLLSLIIDPSCVVFVGFKICYSIFWLL